MHQKQLTIPIGERLDGLTGLRAFAALWVLAFHYSYGPLGPLGAGHASRFVQVGYLGVDQFFILSGFVIWHAHGRELARPRLRSFGRFLCLRLARLYPVHFFTLMLLAVLLLLRPQWGDPPQDLTSYSGQLFALQLMLVQSWGFVDHHGWNYPAWSVSAEWFCYLLFPILAVVASRTGRVGTMVAIGILLLAIGITYETVFSGTLNQSTGSPALLRAAPEFLLGCLLRRLTRQITIADWPWTAIVIGLAGLWSVSFITVLPVGLLAIPLFAALVLAASTSDNLFSRVLSLRPVIAIGAASYSLYLMQAPVEKGANILRSYLSPAHPVRDLGVAAGYLVPLAIGTWLVHLYVENPSRRLLRGWIDSWLPG